jgi:nitroimidazol reductase NimA-like FMN-containing flavoprotein (pyridoxamine 5'-phosphate oxidase superfamily)
MRRKDREIKDISGIEEILLKCKTCHVAMVDNGLPYIVPLSYGYKIIKGRMLELYFHSALEGRKIDILKSNNNVCFEIAQEGGPVHSQTPCDSGYQFSSIIGFGDVIFIEQTGEKSEALSVMFKHQAGRDVSFNEKQIRDVCVFKIVSTDFTGKKSYD